MGNFYILLPVSAEESELRIADLYEYGTTGIAEIEEADGSLTLKASFDDAASAAAFGVPVLEDSTDWIATSHRAWASRLVGDRFFFAPSWSDEPTPAGRWRIDYQDGAACGSGEHPSTRQTLVAMEEVLQPGMRVIDLGCGAGILSLGAKYLQASFVAGIDVEWDSCQLTHKLSGVPVIHGTADCLRGGQFDIVAANISATVLVNYADAILTLVKPGGRVILAGFATEEASIVKSVFGATSLNERIEGEWSCLVLDLDTSDLL